MREYFKAFAFLDALTFLYTTSPHLIVMIVIMVKKCMRVDHFDLMRI